jgi:2-oxoisovalerate dehydrogenase E1 component
VPTAAPHAPGSATERVDQRFVAAVHALPAPPPPRDRAAPLALPGGRATALTGQVAWALFEAQVASRMLDFAGRELRARGSGFYTIGSSGHEGNAVLGELLRPTDLGFLHYRSGALVLRLRAKAEGELPLLDALLSLCASSDDPVAGGRHKIWGAPGLNLPPQTSTIASHLPKAVGAAFASERARRLGVATGAATLADDSLVFATFGDASLNHASAQAALNTALWAAHQNLPVPLLLVCEDNGLGISVPTPPDWVAVSVRGRPHLAYFRADGTDLLAAYDTAAAAIDHCRQARRPTFLHLDAVRLFGHAGSDLEAAYRRPLDIAAAEARDPVLATARALHAAGVATASDLLGTYEGLRERVAALARQAEARPRLASAAEIMAPLAPSRPDLVHAEATRADYAEARRAVFGAALPEAAERPRPLASLINQGLRDLLAKHPQSLVFGEDVAAKGGVYQVTDGLARDFGAGRVFNTLLDETSILGLAIGAAHVGLLPIPEIQFLAYLHNAEDQLRGEAATLQFFSRGRWANPMVVRIAAFGYQRGFGGHFHNDNSIAVLRDVPGLVIAAPARGDDAVGMLRTALAMAAVDGRVVVFLEPIALYHQRDLYEAGDGAWQCRFPAPGQAVAAGRGRVYHGDAADLTIVTYANGLWLSLRAARQLATLHGVHARVVDLRWLAPLDAALVCEQVRATGRALIVDEGRRTGGIGEALVTLLVEAGLGGLPITRLAGEDSPVPLGDAWQHVLPSQDGVVAAAQALVAR